jgi:hypothetical protein
MAVAHKPVPATESYRREREACVGEFGAELARVCSDIHDPIAKLRFLRGALDNRPAPDLRLLPCAPARRTWYRWHGLQALDAILTDGPRDIEARTLTARRSALKFIKGVTTARAAVLPTVGVGLVWLIVATVLDPTPEPHAKASPATTLAPVATAQATDTVVEDALVSAPVAEPLAEETLGIVPTTIWLADRGPGWELYSNGLRIETSHAVPGEARRYRVHDLDKGLKPTHYAKPVGILFHTSESDLSPLQAEFSREVRRDTDALLRFVRREQAYNYLIDRYGRVYRVVDDDSRANHAGHAVWARGEEIYLDLNAAFLGVSFESRWDGGRVLPITRAQLIAGRNLTNYLRQRFSIAPEMCVTHGLASVSPAKHLIGYHMDWARGFPFAAFGLPDLYAHPPPSVALFGFGYDQKFLQTVGERWPGLLVAEQAFASEAHQRALAPDQLRAQRQALYREWSKQVRAPASVARELKTQQAADKRG